MVENQIEPKEESRSLHGFEKYLVIWIILCMAIGIILSRTIPELPEMIDSWQVRGISIPIGICLFFMMYPAMLNLNINELKKLKKQPKPIILTLISNWAVAPFVGLGLALLFLQGQEELTVAVILLHASPCTAMVLVWGYLADGNQEQNVVNTSVNTITIILFYVPMVALLTGIPNIPIDRGALLISLFIFIGLPLFIGFTSKKFLINTKGETWFKETYTPKVGKVAISALLITLIILFALTGNIFIEKPDLLVLVSIPLLLSFVVVVSFNIIITKLAKLKYKEAIVTVIIGSSSHFEIAIATAISIYGVGSAAALGTTVGLFWEVPIMLGLVYLGKYLKKKDFWK